MAYYYANLAQMDDCAGQVLSALKRLGLERNTIVVYTSDHGEMLGDLGLWNKFQFYEGSSGVPLLMKLPATSPALCEQPVSLISLKQTLAELCSVPDLGPSDGASFASLVRNPASGHHNAPIFAEFNVGQPRAKYMIRRGDYKYTHWTHDITSCITCAMIRRRLTTSPPIRNSAPRWNASGANCSRGTSPPKRNAAYSGRAARSVLDQHTWVPHSRSSERKNFCPANQHRERKRHHWQEYELVPARGGRGHRANKTTIKRSKDCIFPRTS